jgi:hypothetical protein
MVITIVFGQKIIKMPNPKNFKKGLLKTLLEKRKPQGGYA